MTLLKIPVTPIDHQSGPRDAPVTLVEYGDYECPYCGHAFPIVQNIRREFEGRLRFVFRNFPLSQSHPHAEAAAEVAEFAGWHAKFWFMHDLLFENQSRFSGPLFAELVEGLGLSKADMFEDLTRGRYRPRIRADFEGGVRSGVNGTPTFFINGRKHNGPFEFEHLADGIVQALEEAGQPARPREPTGRDRFGAAL